MTSGAPTRFDDPFPEDSFRPAWTHLSDVSHQINLPVATPPIWVP